MEAGHRPKVKQARKTASRRTSHRIQGFAKLSSSSTASSWSSSFHPPVWSVVVSLLTDEHLFAIKDAVAIKHSNCGTQVIIVEPKYELCLWWWHNCSNRVKSNNFIKIVSKSKITNQRKRKFGKGWLGVGNRGRRQGPTNGGLPMLIPRSSSINLTWSHSIPSQTDLHPLRRRQHPEESAEVLGGGGWWTKFCA